MSKNELRLCVITCWVIMLISSFITINTKAEVNYNKTYFKQATDVCKQEYIDYNLELNGSRR